MRGPLRFVALTALFSSLLALQSVWAGPYEGQIRLAPESTNMIMLADVQAIYNTPLAKDEGLKQQVKDAFLAGDILVPPTANKVVMLAEVDVLSHMRPIWDLSVVDLYKAPDVLGFAKQQQVDIEHLDGHRMVQTQSGALLLEIKLQRIMTSSLANRQLFSRCLKGVDEAAPLRLSPYLKKAADDGPREGQVVIAVDMDKVITRNVAKDLLGKDALPRALSCLTSMKGLTCVVQMDKTRKVTIRADFEQPVEALGDNPHQALQPLLDIMGFSDNELEIVNPKGAKEKNQVIVRGELMPARLLAMYRRFEATGAVHDYGAADEAPKEVDPTEATIKATQKHLKAIQSMLAELKGTATRDRIAELSEKYAAKIDALPMLNVDPDALTFSANVSGSLRYQAQSKREAGLRTGVRASIPVYNYYGGSYGAAAYNGYGTPYYGAYGTYGFYKRDVPDTAGIATQEQAPATQIRISEMKAIDDGLVKLRRALTEKYKAEF
jgi:hypothetical protein